MWAGGGGSKQKTSHQLLEEQGPKYSRYLVLTKLFGEWSPVQLPKLSFPLHQNSGGAGHLLDAEPQGGKPGTLPPEREIQREWPQSHDYMSVLITQSG